MYFFVCRVLVDLLRERSSRSIINLMRIFYDNNFIYWDLILWRIDGGFPINVILTWQFNYIIRYNYHRWLRETKSVEIDYRQGVYQCKYCLLHKKCVSSSQWGVPLRKVANEVIKVNGPSKLTFWKCWCCKLVIMIILLFVVRWFVILDIFSSIVHHYW